MPRCFNPGARYHEKLAALPPEEAAKVEANRRAKMSAGIKKTLAIKRIVNAILKSEVVPNSYEVDILNTFGYEINECGLPTAAVMILQPWKKQGGEPSPVPEVQATPAQVETTQTENAQPEASGYENNVLMSDIFPSTDWYNAEKWTVFGSEITRDEIGSVTFLDTLEDATKDAWDVSQYGDGSVKAWTEKNGELYDLYIAGKGGVCAPADCSVLFSGYRNAKSINFGSAFHTEKTVDMRYMFSICESLRGLNLSTFRTENVTDMNSMFQYCSNLQVLDISSFSTSAVKNMGRMFMECRALAMLDLSGFDTARVTNMAEMFYRCSAASS